MNRRLNIGCGTSPTSGWINYDNSISLVLARMPRLMVKALRYSGLISALSVDFIEKCRRSEIKRGPALAIPEVTGSVDVIYSSHMMEHLDRREVRLFLAECRRVLKPGGRLRLVVPDLEARVKRYMESKDADHLIDSFIFDLDKPRGFRAWVLRSVTGGREHHWMYDGLSLSKLVRECGFEAPQILNPGETTLVDAGELNLREHFLTESVYLEATRPAA